ncbi:MAG: hypothetical protein ACI4PP_00320, partial [Clostridia bacterium]
MLIVVIVFSETTLSFLSLSLTCKDLGAFFDFIGYDYDQFLFHYLSIGFNYDPFLFHCLPAPAGEDHDMKGSRKGNRILWVGIVMLFTLFCLEMAAIRISPDIHIDTAVFL